MSPNNDLELGLRHQNNDGPDPNGDHNQTTGDQEHSDQSRTDQKSPSIKFFESYYRDASDAGDPDVRLVEYVKNQDGKCDLRTTFCESSREWVRDLDKTELQETSNATEVQADLQVLILRGNYLTACLDTYLRHRRVPQEEIKTLCALVDNPRTANVRWTDDSFGLSWKKISPVLTP